jgi:toxin ParE1/3/4
MVQVQWLREAKNDLKAIYDYISHDSSKYAQRQIRRVKEKTHLLRSQPQIGKIVDEMNQPDIRELIEGNYRIIYRIVSKHRIDILMIHHGARDLNQRLSS